MFRTNGYRRPRGTRFNLGFRRVWGPLPCFLCLPVSCSTMVQLRAAINKNGSETPHPSLSTFPTSPNSFSVSLSRTKSIEHSLLSEDAAEKNIRQSSVFLTQASVHERKEKWANKVSAICNIPQIEENLNYGQRNSGISSKNKRLLIMHPESPKKKKEVALGVPSTKHFPSKTTV